MTLDFGLVEKIVGIIHTNQINLSDEKFTQKRIEELFIEQNIPFVREYRFSPQDIVDFYVADHLAIEIKIKGQKRAIYRQLERYCEHESVKGIMLLTGISMPLPEMIKNKPAFVASLSRAWL